MSDLSEGEYQEMDGICDDAGNQEAMTRDLDDTVKGLARKACDTDNYAYETNGMRLIVSLCDFTGNWPKFYTPEEGYEVLLIDLKHGQDARMVEHIDRPVHGLLAAPLCTPFTVSGAQYWPDKDASGATLEGLALVDACLRQVALHPELKWWALENPVGRLKRWLGNPRLYFDPCDYGDPYTKKTCLWGTFNPPPKNRVEPERVCSQGSWVQKLGGKSERTKELRSATPLGFAKAFRLANP